MPDNDLHAQIAEVEAMKNNYQNGESVNVREPVISKFSGDYIGIRNPSVLSESGDMINGAILSNGEVKEKKK